MFLVDSICGLYHGANSLCFVFTCRVAARGVCLIDITLERFLRDGIQENNIKTVFWFQRRYRTLRKSTESSCLCSPSSPDAPYLKIYLQTALHAKANTRAIKVNEDLVANISSMSMEVQGDLDNSSTSQNMKREVIVNVSTKDLNGVSSANISGNSTVEVYEGRDVILTFETESYPPIANQRWTTPTSVIDNTVYQESYIANGCRLAC